MNNPLIKFYGSAKVGSKGQIVIPVDLRHDFGIEPGETLIFIGKAQQHGFGVMKSEAFFNLKKELKQMEQTFLEPKANRRKASKSKAGRPSSKTKPKRKQKKG
jgi:AbrB family looped-hinge helix DNA binding protein